MQRMIFVNLPVADVARSTVFYEALGFAKNDMFSTDDVVSLVVEENIVLMLHEPSSYRRFVGDRQIGDPRGAVDHFVCFSAESKDETLALKATALANGGTAFGDDDDHGFMYGVNFADPDGHLIAVNWLDMAAAAEQMTHQEGRTA